MRRGGGGVGEVKGGAAEERRACSVMLQLASDSATHAMYSVRSVSVVLSTSSTCGMTVSWKMGVGITSGGPRRYASTVVSDVHQSSPTARSERNTRPELSRSSPLAHRPSSSSSSSRLLRRPRRPLPPPLCAPS